MELRYGRRSTVMIANWVDSAGLSQWFMDGLIGRERAIVKWANESTQVQVGKEKKRRNWFEHQQGMRRSHFKREFPVRKRERMKGGRDREAPFGLCYTHSSPGMIRAYRFALISVNWQKIGTWKALRGVHDICSSINFCRIYILKSMLETSRIVTSIRYYSKKWMDLRPE